MEPLIRTKENNIINMIFYDKKTITPKPTDYTFKGYINHLKRNKFTTNNITIKVKKDENIISMNFSTTDNNFITLIAVTTHGKILSAVISLSSKQITLSYRRMGVMIQPKHVPLLRSMSTMELLLFIKDVTINESNAKQLQSDYDRLSTALHATQNQLANAKIKNYNQQIAIILLCSILIVHLLL